MLTTIIGKAAVVFENVNGQDMPDADYFKIPATSISKLKLLDPECGGSPEKYQNGFTFGYNASLETGTAVHELFLQPEDFQLSDYTGRPSAKLGLFVEKVAEYRKKGESGLEALKKASDDVDYYKGKLSSKRIREAISKGWDYYSRLMKGEFDTTPESVVLSEKTHEAVVNCLNSLNNNWDIQNIIKPNLLEPKQFLKEIALFADIKVTLPKGEIINIPFKGKLDSVVIDPETKTIYLNDLKTTSSFISNFMGYWSGDNFITGSFGKMKYYFQMATYLVVLQMYCRQILHLDDYSYKSNMFVVETTGEHKSANFPVSQAYIDLGIQTMKELLVRLAFHQLYGFDKSIEDYDNLSGTQGAIQ